MTSVILQSLNDTRALAGQVASILRNGDTVLLRGELGTGKTTFAQFLIAALSDQQVEVTSPTFNLAQNYPVTLRDGSHSEIFHYDLYRIDKPSALAELGLEETESAIRLIEWPEKLPSSFAPDSWLSLHFSLQSEQRAVTLDTGGALSQRWKKVAA